MAPHLLFKKKRQKDVIEPKATTGTAATTATTASGVSNNNTTGTISPVNTTPTPTTTTITSTSPTTTARGIFRSCLDVVNLLLIGLFVLKACTDIQPCSVLAKAATAAGAEEKLPAIIVSSASSSSVESVGTSSNLRVVAKTTSAAAAASTTTISTDKEVEAESSSYAIPIDYDRLLSDGQTVVVVLASSGLGSNMIQLLAQKLFYNDRKFNFIVDDSQYGYKWDETSGLVKGFFDPRFPVLSPGDYQQILQKQPYNLPSMEVINANAAYKKERSTDQQILVQWSINEAFRSDFIKNYGNDGIPLYDRFVAEACTNLQFNPRAQHAIQQFIQQQSNVPNLRQTHSVAFHVRRGDKVLLGESRAFAGVEYVNKLIELRNRNWIDPNRDIEHCFVASDDVHAVEEVRKALLDNNFKCQFHTLVSRSEAELGTAKAAYNERESTIQFLAEISLLLDATYFIGSFNSNVGSLAAILRKCHYFGAPHYAHSYGVDREGWFYRS